MITYTFITINIINNPLPNRSFIALRYQNSPSLTERKEVWISRVLDIVWDAYKLNTTLHDRVVSEPYILNLRAHIIGKKMCWIPLMTTCECPTLEKKKRLNHFISFGVTPPITNWSGFRMEPP